MEYKALDKRLRNSKNQPVSYEKGGGVRKSVFMGFPFELLDFKNMSNTGKLVYKMKDKKSFNSEILLKVRVSD